VLKIISGGQTGVDRAALDAALEHGIDCGGWVPAGRLDEFGRIPDRYPVKELEENNKEGRSLDRPGGLETAAPLEKRDVFAARTLQNVVSSDGTAIIYCNELRGGTEKTVGFCIEQKRPNLLIDAGKVPAQHAAYLITKFVREEDINTLNVAGPRESEWSVGYDYAFRALDIFLSTYKMSDERK
jgi:Circularly permutated YpsA SLOG family